MTDSPKVKVFSSSTAMTFELATSKNGAYRTVAIEIAPKIPERENYDWQNKVAFYPTEDELFYLAAFLYRDLPEAIFGGHQGNTKQMVIHRKPNALLFILNQSGSYTCPVPYPAVFRLLNLVLLALHLNQPWVPVELIARNVQALRVPARHEIKSSVST